MKPANKLSAAISIWSNSYGTPTGYGVQITQLIDRLKRSGADVAMLSNYGLEGAPGEIQTPYGKIPHFPRGFEGYSNDVAPYDHQFWAAQNPGKPNLFLSLYDVWVMKATGYDELKKIASWTPIDHDTVPPRVLEWLRKPNVTPIAMAPNGARAFTQLGLEHEYVPHSIDTAIYKPTDKVMNGAPVTDYLASKDRFVVGMVAANKASGLIHRKAFSENLMAFALFHKQHPDSMLYIHSEPLGMAAGWNLLEIVKSLGIPPQAIAFPDPREYRFGLPPQQMAALYTGMDVLLAPSYGEGFGVPTMEAQACGTPVIGSGWAATADLVSEDGWLVDGQPQFDAGQLSWWRIPLVGSIVEALNQAYARGKGRSQVSIDFAANFDTELVWKDYWLPTLNRLLESR